MAIISKKEKSLLRGLAEEVRDIAERPVQKQTRELWRRLNDLEPCRPMLWINEIPWHEMNVGDELLLKCSEPLCRQAEQYFRQTLYCWKHMRADMVVENLFYSPLAIADSGFGIEEEIDFRKEDEENNIFSRDFKPQIKDESDLEKIRTPQISHNAEESKRRFQHFQDCFGDIVPVQKQGITHVWTAPWDYLIRYWGVEEAMLDLLVRPELVHRAIERYVNAHIERLRQWQELNLLSCAEGNYRVGSGALAYSDDLPQKDFDPLHVRSQDQWGCSTAQIFSDVSPQMHKEFALQYEIRWLENFGLNYYGCCEPLHNKIDLLHEIPNLRKISISPWADVRKSAEQVHRDYVLSLKPNPAVLAAKTWDLAQAEKELLRILEHSRGCNVEVVMKDISTVRYEPQRLWQWAEMAARVVKQFSKS
jgi:hypothetical protein